jgi:NAD(P)-dependent dehydrogenase (short-subunit alcohol dehydrogenase family)
MPYAVADLCFEDQVERAFDACLQHYGHVDALFNCAGISGRRFGDGPLHECSLEGWRTTLEVNLQSMFLMSRAVLRHWMESRRRGAILNMASVVAESPEPKHFATHAYATSKGAVFSLTRALASYYAPHGIRVNAISPGLVRTPMSQRAQSDSDLLKYMESKQALSRGMMEPEEIARTALFLLSDDSKHITGQVVSIDGGWSVTPI